MSAKRAFDVVAAVVTAPLWIPVIAVVALLVRARLGSPVMFSQMRPGWHGRLFRIAKFRTMTDARDAGGALLPDAQRLPPFGRWLRSTSLDELPELWNVIRGDMSLVGPRPLLTEYLPLYSLEQARRHDVRPGITGWAQVNGRNATTWHDRLTMDVWYADHRTFWLDVRILLLTILRVFQRHGIAAEGESTMPKFTGGSK